MNASRPLTRTFASVSYLLEIRFPIPLTGTVPSVSSEASLCHFDKVTSHEKARIARFGKIPWIDQVYCVTQSAIKEEICGPLRLLETI